MLDMSAGVSDAPVTTPLILLPTLYGSRSIRTEPVVPAAPRCICAPVMPLVRLSKEAWIHNESQFLLSFNPATPFAGVATCGTSWLPVMVVEKTSSPLKLEFCPELRTETDRNKVRNARMLSVQNFI